jgi:hypothetical protein
MRVTPNTVLPKNLKKIEVAPQSQSELLRYNPYDIPTEFEEFLPTCTIRSGNKLIDFLPFEYQTEIGRLIDIHKKVMIFKVRQTGISELCAAKMFHKAMLNPAYAGAAISMGQTESSKLSKRIQLLPGKVRGFEWSGVIYFRPSTDNAARSFESIEDLFFDEAAFPPNFAELYANAGATQQMVGDAACRIVASTMSPEGKLSHFWQMFDSDNPVDAEEEVNRVKEGREEPFHYWIDNAGWAKVIVHWRSHPIYRLNPNYLEDTQRKEKITDAQLQREYNLGIPASGGSLFNPESVDKCAIGAWAEPEERHDYLVCIDPNFGGSDYWRTLVWDISVFPYSLVAAYGEQDRSTTYSQEKTISLIEKYDAALTAVESNSGGMVVAENLAKALPDRRIELTRTSHASKRQNTDRIAISIEQGEVQYPSDWVGIGEMKRFSAVQREAITGHDDSLMAWAAGWAWLEVALEECGTADWIGGV